MDNVTIRPMQAADLDFAAQCTADEGWDSETREEFEGFWAYDPDGCLIAEAEGQAIGIGIATSYGETGFIGELIVAAAWRGRGVGQRLMDRAVTYLRGRGAHSLYLDGVLKAVPLYERAGFRKICRSLRFYGHLEGRPSPTVRPMRAADMETISAADQRAFGADRRFFLERRLTLYPELCKVLALDGEIGGFILGRRTPGIVSAGPWWVHPDAPRPADLLAALALEAGDAVIGLGVLETNAPAVTLIRTLGLSERPTPPWRMVLGESERLGVSPDLYANGSAAKG